MLPFSSSLLPKSSFSLSRPFWRETIAFLFFLLLSFLLLFRTHERLSPDGTVYLSLGRYLVEGEIWHAISSHWSPLLSWGVAVGLALGIDSLWAGKLVLITGCGIGWLASLFLLHRMEIPKVWHFPLLLVLSIHWAYWSFWILTPDPLSAALLLLYFSIALRADFLNHPSLHLLVGMLGGLAYLAKAYAFFFFLVSYILTFVLHAWRYWHEHIFPNRRRSLRLLMGYALRGILGLLLVAGPWITLISWKSGRFTITDQARNSYNINAPVLSIASYGMWEPSKPRPPYWSSFLDLGSLSRPPQYSPFENRHFLLFFIRRIFENLKEVRILFMNFDPLGISLALACITPFFVFCFPARSPYRFLALWITIMLMLYVGGYLPFIVEARYFQPLWFPVLLLWGAFLISTLLSRLSSNQRTSIFFSWIPFLFAIVFSLFPGFRCIQFLWQGEKDESRRIAHELIQAGIKGPLASSRWAPGMIVVYHMNACGQRFEYLGEIGFVGPEGVEGKLASFGAQTYLAWTLPGVLYPPIPTHGWTHRFSFRKRNFSGNYDLDVYIRKERLSSSD